MARRLLEARERERRREVSRLTGRLEREEERLDLDDLRGIENGRGVAVDGG
jgi:hypothetical protein